ncbi:MAG: hypothetical protein UT24_C0002G0011 [Candidatus Woesebacteria bacterium GW2011_GWB1_39_12]|uniref:Glycosyltransferase RgtA/B/C/D-like domain-containing protein n=3 Tax=Candidatus Woeseibacteriota TaxID=1752722 RepID=A0A0G0MEX8_9BACT|nr:MAG: hypothetical protein UT24_C0002G0011 [Candidatus Woesebacteria bacterium GW2011_GWB1_39_12]
MTLFLLLFVFSSFLMWKTFQVTPEGDLKLASRVWSDFAATIPLIRSFSFGSNFPPEYPIFAGPPIRYHFLFFAAVGLLEKTGIRLDLALNSLSTISFFLLTIAIYYLGKMVFKSKKVGILSVILFLFNGSWGFLEFFKKNPISLNILDDIVKNREFSSFGPYDGKIVSAFWSLNIFTNQRHLGLAYAAFLFLMLFLYRYSKKPRKLTLNKICILGIILGLFPFIHMAVFGMMGIAILVAFLIFPKIRINIFALGCIALILAIPQFLYMGESEVQTSLIRLGYLLEDKTFIGFLKYWLMNFGFTLILAPIGFVIAKKPQKKIALPFLALFVAGNIFQFSPEVAANHKFFNLFIIGANLFTAYFLFRLWKLKSLNKVVKTLLLLPLLLLLTLTGLIDFFPIVNDSLLVLKDHRNNPTISFILNNTPKDSVFLNSSYLYHPASLAGRKIFMGWPYFSWSAGYDTDKRGKELDRIYTSNEKEKVCYLLKKNNIDYFTIQDTSRDRDFTKINVVFFNNNFTPIYKDLAGAISIFEVKTNCTTTHL